MCLDGYALSALLFSNRKRKWPSSALEFGAILKVRQRRLGKVPRHLGTRHLRGRLGTFVADEDKLEDLYTMALALALSQKTIMKNTIEEIAEKRKALNLTEVAGVFVFMNVRKKIMPYNHVKGLEELVNLLTGINGNPISEKQGVYNLIKFMIPEGTTIEGLGKTNVDLRVDQVYWKIITILRPIITIVSSE